VAAFGTLATRSGIPLKCMIDGPSGSGKTYTALEIATGLSQATGRPIGVADSQNGQSKRYAGTFEFYCEIIRNYDPRTYIELIREAERAKLSALVIDSATHEWSYCLDLVDTITKRSGAGSGWREVTPQHKRFVEAIIQATVPIICTVRTKTDWLYLEETRNGRKQVVPHKVGTKPEQRDQFEFEFDLWLRMDRDNKALVEKSVFPFLENGTDIGRPDRTIGTRIVEWFEGTSFDAEAELDERNRHARASDPQATERRRSVPASDGPMTGQVGPGEIIDPDTLPADDIDDAAEDDEPDENEARALLIGRYRTLAAVAVMKRHQDAFRYAGASLDQMTDAELDGYIRSLESIYPNVKSTGAYQCDVCGKKIRPHEIEEYRGSEFPGLKLIAISMRDFKRPLCAEHLAVERTKARKRGDQAS
jgi:hypothetical protein